MGAQHRPEGSGTNLMKNTKRSEPGRKSNARSFRAQ